MRFINERGDNGPREMIIIPPCIMNELKVQRRNLSTHEKAHHPFPQSMNESADQTFYFTIHVVLGQCFKRTIPFIVRMTIYHVHSSGCWMQLWYFLMNDPSVNGVFQQFCPHSSPLMATPGTTGILVRRNEIELTTLTGNKQYNNDLRDDVAQSVDLRLAFPLDIMEPNDCERRFPKRL